MTYSLTWLESVLKNAGLKVAPVEGWQNRGRAEMGAIKGVICHHTAGPANGNMPSLKLIVAGRADLPGPLSQLGLGRDGTWYVIAAGRCNHAGAGSWNGVTTGNSSFIGIEAENTGLASDPWPAIQMDAYRRGVAAILKHSGLTQAACCGHKEYALPAGRKPDPSFNMYDFRTVVQQIMDGRIPTPPSIPAVEPKPAVPGQPPRATLRRGAKSDGVKALQQLLKLTADGEFGAGTEARVRQFQRDHGFVPDGIVGPKTWALLDQKPPS